MALRTSFRPEAEMEVEAACLWYDRQRAGLGLQFLLSLEATTAVISESPRAFPKVAGRTRRALLLRFPYLLFYVLESDRILVTGVFHGRRSPGVWADRLCEPSVPYGVPVAAAGRPISVMRLSTLQTIRASTTWASRLRARSLSPKSTLYRKKVLSIQDCR